MDSIALLIGVPIVSALVLLLVKSQTAYALVVRLSSVIIIGISLYFVTRFYSDVTFLQMPDISGFAYVLATLETVIAAYIIISGLRAKKYLVSVFALMQIITILAYEFTVGHNVAKAETFFIDSLSLIMVLIIGVVGSLICIFAVAYMKDYHHHHGELKDRRSMFYCVLFIFLSAMFGLVITNEMTLMLFFWEVTSLCSFLLIGYSQTEEAKNNAFLALTINVFGGLLFTIGIVLLGVYCNVGDFQTMLVMGTLGAGGKIAIAAVFLMAVAGLTKSAQMPFSKWLLGAMVAPTPTSAMLHSSTMVKAGVYLIIRLAPMLGLNAAGITITMIGAITFLVTAIMAVSQSDAKRILAYSTISNLGLIVACASVNTPESIWAAIMLIIFHAVAKSLLFLTVGSTEHQLGSRNVESMDGLYNISAKLTVLLSVGIAGMFIAPFGMLISKWAAMKAFLDYNNVVVLMMLAFGSTITFFFWTKWLGKLIANTKIIKPEEYKMSCDEKSSLYVLAVLVIGLCALYPLASKYFVIPYIETSMITYAISPFTTLDTSLILTILFMLFILTVVMIPLYKSIKAGIGTVYMAGENTGDDQTYNGSMGQTVLFEIRNWYMQNIFGEKIWFVKSQIASTAVIVIGFVMVLGGYLI